MSVIGVGLDIVDVTEFAALLDQAGSTMQMGFRVSERRDAASRTGDPARHLAVRWAAREAVIKAWSSSRFAQAPVLPETAVNDIEVITDNWGRPHVRLHGDLAKYLAGVKIHISLTHDGSTAAAVAILEE
ncbi:holo-ACP synthase [Gordonia sp. (in: high G+C Gram-positive bacteria)]|uniref:holo-ACP synthase AcpS n=1 Tax=Gordonia sp. (in: high G+C Gram-positive bacteria) TaxID=84139 RepID=UPI00260B02DA|nr:holo-ACP synthase [Gordonia sp. (in: high G+C Gram-positive bacteria)]